MENVGKEHDPVHELSSGDEGVPRSTSDVLVRSASSSGSPNNDHKNKNKDESAVVSKDAARIMKKLLAASSDGVIKSDMKTLALVYKLDRMKYKHKQELNELKANYKNKEQKNKEQQQLNEQVRKELVNLYNEFSCGVKMVGSLKGEIELLRGQLTSSHQTTEDKVSVFRDQFEKETHQLKERNQTELERLQKEHSADIEKINAEHEQRMRGEALKQEENTRELEEKHSIALREALAKLTAELAEKHGEDAEKLRKENQDAEARHARDFEVNKLSQSEQVSILRDEIEQIRRQHAEHVASLRQQEEQLKQQHVADLAQQDQVNKNHLVANNEAHNKQVEVLISTQQLYQKEIDRLKIEGKEFAEKSKKEYDDMVEHLEKKYSDEKERLVGDHTSEHEKYKQSMEERIEQMTEDNKKQVYDLTEEHARDVSDWETKHSEQDEAHNKAIASLHLDYQAQIAAMERVLSDLKHDWENKKVTTQKEQELNTANNLQMILSLNNQRTHEIQQMQEGYDTTIQQYSEKQKELIAQVRALKEENVALKKKHPCLHDHGHHHHGSSNSRPSSPAGPRPGSPAARPGSPAARTRSPSVGSPARPGSPIVRPNSPSVRPSSPKTAAQRMVVSHAH